MPRKQSPLSLEYILLGFLDQNPIHGYDLHKKLSTLEGVALVWHIKQAQMYALLERLEAEGLISARIIPGEAHPARKEYRITSSGKEQFRSWRITPVDHSRDMRQEFMAKLYFASAAGKADALRLLDEQMLVSLKWLVENQNHLDEPEGQSRFEELLFRYRVAQAKTTLEWLEQCRSEFLQGGK
jgi:DNA-binding PadR family transcriptional regulator